MKQNQNQHQQGKNQPAGKDTGFGASNKPQQRTDYNKPTMGTQTPNRPGQPNLNTNTQGGKGFGGHQKNQGNWGGKNKDDSHR